MQIKLTLPEKPKTARRVRAGKSVWKPRRVSKVKTTKARLEKMTDLFKQVMLQKMSQPESLPWTPVVSRYSDRKSSRFRQLPQTNYFKNEEPKVETGPSTVQRYVTFEEVQYARPINPEPPEVTPEQWALFQAEMKRAMDRMMMDAMIDADLAESFQRWVVGLEREEALKLDLEFDLWAQRMERAG